jgi:hypothetical protein
MGFERDTKLYPLPHKLYLSALYMPIFGAPPDIPFFCTICVPTIKKIILVTKYF